MSSSCSSLARLFSRSATLLHAISLWRNRDLVRCCLFSWRRSFCSRQKPRVSLALARRSLRLSSSLRILLSLLFASRMSLL